MSKKTKKIDWVKTIFICLICTILVLYTLSLILTLLWGLLTSLKSHIDFEIYGNLINIPSLKWSETEFLKFGNYTKIFKDFKITSSVDYFVGNTPVGRESTDTIGTMLLNTLVYAGLVAILRTVVPAVMAYMCAKYRCKMSDFLNALVVIVMTIPIVGNYPSMISTLRALNLFDTYFGLMIMNFGFGGMYFLVFYAYFSGLSDTYAEAAEIDGASQFRILTMIIMPLAIKIMSTVFMILFVQRWNDYRTALIYMPTHPTLAYGVYYLSIGTNKGTFAFVPAKTASCMMLAIPILVLFIACKDKIMGNVTIGGIKG